MSFMMSSQKWPLVHERRFRKSDHHPQEDSSKSSYELEMKLQIFNHPFIFSALYWNQVQKSGIWFLGLLVVHTWNPPKITSFWHFFLPSLILLFRRNLASDKRQYNILSGRGQERKTKEGVWSFGAFLKCYSMKRWSASFWVCKFLKLLHNMWCVVLSGRES
jgi:hypothetical protein